MSLPFPSSPKLIPVSAIILLENSGVAMDKYVAVLFQAKRSGVASGVFLVNKIRFRTRHWFPVSGIFYGILSFPSGSLFR